VRQQTSIHLAADDLGRLLVFASGGAAGVFAARLRDRGIGAVSYPVNSAEARTVLAWNEVTDPGQVNVVEVRTTGPADAARWAVELTDR
jgi:hypothetical protein